MGNGSSNEKAIEEGAPLEDSLAPSSVSSLYSDTSVGESNAYESDDDEVLVGNHNSSSQRGALDECYRLSLFERKKDPLTVLGGPRGAQRYPSTRRVAVTKNASQSRPPRSIIQSNNNPSVTGISSLCVASSLPATRTTKRLSSFSYCVDGVVDQTDWDEEENELSEERTTSNNSNGDDEEEYHSSTYSMGCVTSQLSLPRTNSWTSLILDDELAYTQDELDMKDGDEPTWESDLRPSEVRGPRQFWIVTTAALPWQTGTSINPLLRAAYLSRRNRPYAKEQSTVTLVLPWLESSDDRVALYGNSWKDSTPEDQDAYIRRWLAEAAALPLESDLSRGGIAIQFYPARYHAGLSSIFAMGDLCQLIPKNSSNIVCILEEPEHVNFYRAPGRQSWRDKFDHVVGIVHTNYKAYASSHYSGLVTGPLVGAMSALMVRAYCDKVVKLSPVLQSYAPEKEIVSNVHGIRSEFFSQTCSGNKVYFIGKLLWAKGLDKILDLQSEYRRVTGEYWDMDIFGSGPEQDEIQRAFLQPYYGTSQKRTGRYLPPMSPREWRRQPIPARFLGRKDHVLVGEEYKVFVNPSITEVLCTTTAESIAMGKWVIVPAHPSNTFFTQFPNCLQYSTKSEFVQLLQYAISHPPIEVDKELLIPLSWEAATDRFMDSAFLSKRNARRRDRIGKDKMDERIAKLHYQLGKGLKGDMIRKVLGGGPVAEQHQYEHMGVVSATPGLGQLNGLSVATIPVAE